jgi:exopolyphosphatase / guanosine-5'-triphosphate,3'-diphosphate pyrophosphatase
MSRYATIDVGSNSVLIHIVEKEATGNLKILDDQAELSRLGEGLQATGELKDEAIERTILALKNFMNLSNSYKVDQVAAVGTMALRIAKNSATFLKRVETECNLKIEVIPGEEEARLSYLAVKSGLGLKEGNIAIFDVGGGSTEFIFGKGDEILKRFSVNIGCIRFTEQYLKSNPVTESELESALQQIEKEFADLKPELTLNALVGMGGTITNVTGVMHKLAKYNPDIVQGSSISKNEIIRQIKLYQSISIEDRKSIVGLQPKRADVILAGVCIVKIIMDKLGMDNFVVSDRGIRHGLMYDRFKDK